MRDSELLILERFFYAHRIATKKQSFDINNDDLASEIGLKDLTIWSWVERIEIAGKKKTIKGIKNEPK